MIISPKGDFIEPGSGPLAKFHDVNLPSPPRPGSVMSEVCMIGHGWRYLTADEVVAEHPIVLRGIVLLTSTTGGDVTLYDGLEAAGGRLIGRFEGIADTSTVVDLFGLHLEHGLFVDIGSNVTSVLVIYDPIPSEMRADPPGQAQAWPMGVWGY